MSTGLDVFDRTLQKSNLWLKALQEELNWADRHDTYMALRAVLHTLRDRLTPGEAGDLAAQLPLLLKGVFYDGYRPGAAPEKIRGRQEFLAKVKDGIEPTRPEANPDRVARAVFRVLANRISEGEIAEVVQSLPEELRGLWPEEATA